MHTSKKATGRAKTIPGGLAVGTAVFFIIIVLCGIVIAKIIERQIVAENNSGYLIAAAMIISSYAGCEIAIKQCKRRLILVAILSGVVYTISLLSITALFFGGEYEAIFPTTSLIFCGCVTVILFNLYYANRKKEMRKVKHRYR